MLISAVTMPASKEAFQPRAHWAPDTPGRRLLYHLRLLGDLQTNTIYRDLKRELTGFAGNLLDVGCGNSPFRHLLDAARTTYQGVDIQTAADFGYRNPDTVYYDGQTLPFADNSFAGILCTEVLEHVPDPAPFVREVHRVLKPGGLALVTIPWSARFHYQPHDYHRYTPSMLRSLFAAFSRCEIRARGTDYTAIASKIVVIYARNLLGLKPRTSSNWLLIPVRLVGAVLAFPLLLLTLALGHAGILFGCGSDDDPLGYTIILRK
jgi:SAM-dependent methyltransferase